MDYSSQFGLMRQKAAEGKLSFVKILDYYRDRLLHLHTSCPDMAPNLQQYRAEYQTWSSIWPEQPVPGVEPTPPIVPSMAPTSASTGSDSGDYDTLNATLEPTSNLPTVTRTSSAGSTPRAIPSVFPQISASGQNVSHRNATTTQQQATAKVVQKPQDQRTCGACYQKGHVLADCTRKVDVYGFLVGCPLYNTTKHNIDQCNGQTQGKHRGKNRRPSELFYYLVVRRIGKPPVRSRLDFRFINPEKWAVLDRYPQTCQFAAYRRNNKIVQGVEEQVDDPNWTDPNSVKSQIHPLEAKVTSGLLNFTESSTPARISNQQLPEELHLAQQRNSFRSPSAPTPEVQPTSDNLPLPSPSVPGTKLHDYHGQSSAARPTNPSGNSQTEERNHVVPPAVPQFSSIPTVSPTPVYNRSGAWAMHAAAQSEMSHCGTHETFNSPHSETPSFSELGQSEPEIRFQEALYRNRPQYSAKIVVDLPTTGLSASCHARNARKWAIRLRDVRSVQEHCTLLHLGNRGILVSQWRGTNLMWIVCWVRL